MALFTEPDERMSALMKREHFTSYNTRMHADEHRFHHDGHGFGGGPRMAGWPERPGFGRGFGPGFGGPGGRRRAKGDVRSAILSLLGDGPLNGYAIIKAVAEKTDDAWRPSPGSVYPTLQQLVDEGLITPVGEGRKTEFELTDDGRAYVADHEDELNRAWASVPQPAASAVELFQAVGKLMGVLGQFRHTATDEQRKAATEKIDETRKALYLILAD